MCVEHELSPPDPGGAWRQARKRGVGKGSRVVSVVHICQTGSTGMQLNVQQWSLDCLAEQTYLTMGWQLGKQPDEVPGDSDWHSLLFLQQQVEQLGRCAAVLG